MNIPEYLDLFEHMTWADGLMWRSVLALPEPQQERALIERLYHLHVVQRVYLQLWRSEPLSVPEVSTFANLAALAEWVAPYHAEARELVASLDADALRRGLPIPWAERVVKLLGRAEPSTLGETLLQVVLHSGYHRGQIAMRTRELGGEPPLTDYIAWLWQGRPAATPIGRGVGQGSVSAL